MSVLKITLPGYDVMTETDPRHISLDSDQFVHMMRLENEGNGNHEIAASIGTDSLVIPHNLGYVPFFKVYGYWSDATYGSTGVQDMSFHLSDPFYANFDFVPKIDDMNLTLRWLNASGQGGMTVYFNYFIGRDPL